MLPHSDGGATVPVTGAGVPIVVWVIGVVKCGAAPI